MLAVVEVEVVVVVMVVVVVVVEEEVVMMVAAGEKMGLHVRRAAIFFAPILPGP